MPLVQVKYLDHIVLNVYDMDKVLDFYVNTLGLKPVRLSEYQQGKAPFPSVRVNEQTIIDLFPIDAKNVNQEETSRPSCYYYNRNSYNKYHEFCLKQ